MNRRRRAVAARRSGAEAEQAVALHKRLANAAGARPAIVAMLHLMSRPVAGTAEVPGPISRWRPAHSSGRPGHRAAEGRRREQHPADRARARAAAAVSTGPPHGGCSARSSTTGWSTGTSVTQRYTVGYGATVVASAVTDDALIRQGPAAADRPVPAHRRRRSRSPSPGGSTWSTSTRSEPPTMMAPNWLDKPLPLHATSGGKAFLAWLGRDERDAHPARGPAALYRAHGHRPGSSSSASSPRSAGPGSRSATGSTRSSPPGLRRPCSVPGARRSRSSTSGVPRRGTRRGGCVRSARKR